MADTPAGKAPKLGEETPTNEAAPGSAAKMSPEEKQRATRWYEKNTKDHSAYCPICKTSQWVLLDHFVSPTMLGPQGFVFSGPTYPHFMLACQHCGNIQFINASATGVRSKPDQKK